MVNECGSRRRYPILSITGEQGTAKSTACGYIRRLIDPNTVDLRLTPKEPRDLMIMARNSHVLAFDNLSHIPDWLSDACCALVTGGGFSTRELLSNHDESLFSAARPILVNGITDVVTRPDLLNRTMVVTLEPIPDHARRSEADLHAQFRDLHPAMLGALLDAVSMALKHEATTTLAQLPRMADFAIWVTAAEPALGLRRGTFIDAYANNQQTAVENSLDGDVVVDTVRGLDLPWKGQLKDLLNAMPQVEDRPKSPRALGNALRRKAPALRQVGIAITFSKTRGHGGQRLIEIARTAAPAVSTMERGPAPRVVPVLGDWDDDDRPTHTVGDIAGLLADANRYQSDAVTA